MVRAFSAKFSAVVFASALLMVACHPTPPPNNGGDPPPPGPGTPPPPPPPIANAATPMSCDDFCNKVNSVPGCVFDPANIPACTQICNDMQKNACKDKLQAQMMCVGGASLKCKGPGQVDYGACSAQEKDANDCFKTLPTGK